MNGKIKKQSEFVRWMGPLLDCLRSMGGSAKPREVTDWIAETEHLSDEQREKLKSGQERFYNQVHWARQYLVWEGLLESSQRGVWILTKKGWDTKLSEQDSRRLFKKWVGIHAKLRQKKEKEIPSVLETPDDILAEETPEELAKEDLLTVLRALPPNGFELVCKRLLRESGFEKVTVTGKSHDGGIDGIGILQINPFVSFRVLFQCKRYKGTVSRAEVGDFRNAVMGRADKGIILTTGIFSIDATREANREGVLPIELVDGEKLVSMFESAQLGLIQRVVYEVDQNFFEQFRNIKAQ